MPPLAQWHSCLVGDWRCSLMWPQPCFPPHPVMLEETRQSKLAAAKKKLKEYQQRNSLGDPAGAKTKKKKTESSTEKTTSDSQSSFRENFSPGFKALLNIPSQITQKESQQTAQTKASMRSQISLCRFHENGVKKLLHGEKRVNP
ncbi:uncharacterized protein LOC106999260 [Macaca mulatta]